MGLIESSLARMAVGWRMFLEFEERRGG